jgi:hypothetical protein
MMEMATINKRLLKLTYADAGGEPYHVCTVSPRVARDLLARSLCHGFYMAHVWYPLHCLSHAEIARQSRAVYAKPQGPHLGQEIIITLAED